MQSLSDREQTCLLEFDDSSKMRLKIGNALITFPAELHSPIQSVRQNEVAIGFDLENSQSLAFPLSESTSCLLLRDKNGGFEYAD